MSGDEANPYAQPTTVDLEPPRSVLEGPRIDRLPLFLAGGLLAFQACMKVFGLSAVVSAMVARAGSSTELPVSWPMLVGIAPSAIGFVIPLLLALALLFGKARYRTAAWLYVDIATALGLVSVAAMWSLQSAVLPKAYVVGLCAEKIFFAVAVSLLLMGRPRTSRVVVGALFGLLHVVNVFGAGWLL